MTEVYEIRPGTEFGYLRVLNQGDSDARGAAQFWVVCRAPGCGTRRLMRGHRLRSGVRSCGCRHKVPAVVTDAVEPGAAE